MKTCGCFSVEAWGHDALCENRSISRVLDTSDAPAEHDCAEMEEEVQRLRAEIAEISKARDQLHEALAREVGRGNGLERERDDWKARSDRFEAALFSPRRID